MDTPGARLNGIISWLTGASREQKRTLLAASLGWMLDSMDVMLYALVLGQVQREMHLSAAVSGAMMSATLASAAVGGLGFGWFADRFGRTRALTWSILIYSVSTAMCGLTHTAWQLMICRVVLGLGMGGEWASGAALVAETWPAHKRGKALALVQSSWAVGYALGAGVVALVMPHFGWRAVFFVGVAPALVTRPPDPALNRTPVGPGRHRSLVGVDVPVGQQVQFPAEHLPVQLRERQAPPAALAEK